MSGAQFRAYQVELVGEEEGLHARLAALLGTSEIGVKRFSTGARPVPGYVAQSLRAMVLLHRSKKLNRIGEMP
jgi:hypothetical protein